MQATQEISNTAPPSENNSEKPSTGFGGKILIADDDQDFRQFVATLLSREGYMTGEAVDAESAFKALQSSSFELLVADVNMPGNAQLEFLKELQESGTEIPVILVTGYPTMETAIDSLKLPVSAYLVKPFDNKEFLLNVKQALLRSKLLGGILKTKERISHWRNHLDDLESLVKLSSSGFSAGVPIDFYITLTVQNIIDPLFDLVNLSQGLVQEKSDKKDNVCNLFKCPRLHSHEKMISHTVDVLETTKKSFKSKTVAELRGKLERYLDTST